MSVAGLCVVFILGWVGAGKMLKLYGPSKSNIQVGTEC